MDLLSVDDIYERVDELKKALISDIPFFEDFISKLKLVVMHLEAGTACTDMQRIYFDPDFADELWDDEVKFVLLHEVMHCVLCHCVRVSDYNLKLYNICADIVANSFAMQAISIESINGDKIPHIAPDGHEGYMYTVEEIYEMFMEKFEDITKDPDIVASMVMNECDIDDHGEWQFIEKSSYIVDEWKKLTKENQECIKRGLYKGKHCGIAHGLIHALMPYMERVTSKNNWKQLMREYMHLVMDKNDYSFCPPDRRFQTGDFFLPSFNQCDEERSSLKNIWIFIDVSGSVSEEALFAFGDEMRAIISQISDVKGILSFFDTEVSDPVDFSLERLRNVSFVGRGGTSFESVFAYLRTHISDHSPEVIVVFTDGYSEYPDESAALNIPVLWVIINNPDDAPWGKTIHISESR